MAPKTIKSSREISPGLLRVRENQGTENENRLTGRWAFMRKEEEGTDI